MATAEDVRAELYRLIEVLPVGELAELARVAERLQRRNQRQARLEWVSAYVRRLPDAERPEAWTALLWLLGEKPVEPTAEERHALHEPDSDAVSWAQATRDLGL